MNNEKKKNILILALVIIVIMLAILLSLVLKKKSDNNQKQEKNVQSGLILDDTNNYKNELIVYYNKDETEFCVYADDEADCSTKNIVIKTKDKANSTYAYIDRYVFYDDDGKKKVYDDKTKESYIININSNYNSYIYEFDKITYDFIGILFQKEDDDDQIYSYYSLELNKIMYESKYSDLELLSKDYLTGNEYSCDLDGTCLQSKAILLSTKEEKELMTYDIKKDKDGYTEYKRYGVLENKNGIYIYLGNYVDTITYDYIYNNDYKLIATGYDEDASGILEDGNLYLTKDGIVSIVDKDGNTIKTTKKYNIEQVIDKYIIHLKDNKLMITTLDENEEYKITDWNKKYIYHTGISGWYEENGKHGIYMVVQDNSVKYTDVWNYCNKNNSCEFDNINEYKNMDYGYEYYFIPETKEVGKIPTYIGGYAKPVIYLYPEKETNITVKFSNPNNITTTYPKYENSWEVKAYPNGDLYDKNNNYYYALYFEENLNHYIDFNEGFYVEKDEAIKFLEEKLSYIGLNQKERNECIMYYLPILEKNEKSLVYFELTEERNNNSKIIITPKPDSMLRVALHVKKVDKKINIKEEKLTKFNRKGFSVVEWGGVIY